MKDYNFFEFFTAGLVFPQSTRKDIKYYLIASFLIVLSTQIYAGLTSFVSIKSAVLVATMLLILMPFFVYFKSVLKRNVETIKTGKVDKSIHFWLFSRKIFHLLLIIISYIWLATLLLAASMAIIAK